MPARICVVTVCRKFLQYFTKPCINQRKLIADSTVPPEKRKRSSELDGMYNVVLLSICMPSHLLIKSVDKESWNVVLTETVRALKQGQEEMQKNIKILLERTLEEGKVHTLCFGKMFCALLFPHHFCFCRKTSGFIQCFCLRLHQPSPQVQIGFCGCRISRVIWW